MSDETRRFYCPCGLTCMEMAAPSPDARLVATTFICQHCGAGPQNVPTAWDQP